MNVRLKPLKEQVIVITGASSGIGLATARMASDAGAKLVLAARSDDALTRLTEEIRHRGRQAIHVVADVGSEDDVTRVADEAIRAFGGFDTWINNAGVSVYGTALEVSIADMRRLFDTNFWGVVYGSRIAAQHLRRHSGALINVGSEVSDVAVPLQGIYSASKHAVKGWTDALRMELEHERAPVSVTLIKPGPIDTPYTQHAKNYMEDAPTHVPPVYTPKAVAEAILHAAATPVRDLYIGSGAKFAASMHDWAPRLSDKVFGTLLMRGTHSGRPRHGRDALHQAGETLRERGDYDGMARASLYTRASMHPVLTGVAAAGVALLVARAWDAENRRATRAPTRPGAHRSRRTEAMFDSRRAHSTHRGAREYAHDKEPSTVATVASKAVAAIRADADQLTLMQAYESLHPKAIEKLTPTEARRNPTAADAVAKVLHSQRRSADPETLVPGVNSRDTTIPGAAGALPARVFTPSGAGPFPVILYFHGGGWVIANKQVYDSGARGLSAQANAVVVSVDYRLAPEHKFPAAWDDCLAAYRWLTTNAASLNGDPSRLGLAGESAGGGLAIATAVAARDAGLPLPKHVLSVYPIAQNSLNTESYLENAIAKPLNRAMMEWFFEHVSRTPADLSDPRIDLVHADLAGLPPVTIVNARLDPLRSDGAQLAAALERAGVAVEREEYSGVAHEFFGAAAVLAKAQEAQAYAGRRLRESLSSATR